MKFSFSSFLLFKTPLKRVVSIAMMLGIVAVSTLPVTSSAQHITTHAVKKSAHHSITFTNTVAFDKVAIGDRQPLILIHGIGGTRAGEFRKWGGFLDHVEKTPEFNERYKIYIFQYDSSKSVEALSKSLEETLLLMANTFDDKRLKVVAYSEGGLLARNAMQNYEVDRAVEQVITVATPFHGSPLAHPSWMEAPEKPKAVQFVYDFAYRLAEKRHPSFRTDFEWDFYPDRIRALADLKASPELANTPALQSENPDYLLEDKKRFITYASYFKADDEEQKVLAEELDYNKPMPKHKKRVLNLFRKNVMFSFIGNTMGKLAVLPKKIKQKTVDPIVGRFDNAAGEEDTLSATIKTTEEAQEENAQEEAYNALSVLDDEDMQALAEHAFDYGLMAYNDGISPISSSLWLGRFTEDLNAINDTSERVWEALKSLRGTGRARLFYGLDHSNWMDGRTRLRSSEIADLLNPDEPNRTMYDWLVYDLMKEEPIASHK